METIQMELQKRGMLTQRIKETSVKLLGYEITQVELRLMPYLQYTLVNDQRLKLEHINKADREILAKWVSRGYILDGVTECGRPMLSEGIKLKVQKEFWNSILEILWLGYVDLHE